MKFWKFECNSDETLVACLDRKRLPPANSSYLGLANTFNDVVSRMGIGDAVVLARLEGEAGKISAIGVVRAIDGGKTPVIEWVRERRTVFPDERGGLVHWQTKAAFEIASSPAKRYGLPEVIKHYFSKPR